MPGTGVLRLDDRAFVAVVRYGDVVLWHYAFGDHWCKVNCTTDPDGRLVETASPGHGVVPFAFNCDIATPMLRRGTTVSSVDLWLDVLVRRDGVTCGVYDQEEFDDALRRGLLSAREAAGARAGLGELLDLVHAGQLMSFLAEAHPLVPVDAPHAMPMRRVPVAEVPLVQPGVRPSW